MLKSAVGMVRDTLNLNSPRAGGEPRGADSPSASSSPQHLPQQPEHPAPPSYLPQVLLCKIHKLPLFHSFHIDTLTLLGLCTSPQPRVPCFNRHFTKHVHGGFSHTQKLVNQPEPFPLPLTSHGYALQRALFTCQATKQHGKTAAFMILQ